MKPIRYTDCSCCRVVYFNLSKCCQILCRKVGEMGQTIVKNAANRVINRAMSGRSSGFSPSLTDEVLWCEIHRWDVSMKTCTRPWLFGFWRKNRHAVSYVDRVKFANIDFERI
jgi:hypothetical protein